eukprot:TRINITY_DN19673_c0_g1_i2.p1 TRINITY_DN19673_c0_g1~~TRINITY_DN19673_c0_g1_i2.p1  ORF type:complete len:631 (-),score=125.01 TRINITY_DN19673_c0_g1_i2:55-1947(-)
MVQDRVRGERWTDSSGGKHRACGLCGGPHLPAHCTEKENARQNKRNLDLSDPSLFSSSTMDKTPAAAKQPQGYGKDDSKDPNSLGKQPIEAKGEHCQVLRKQLQNLRYRLAREKGMPAGICKSMMKMALENVFMDSLVDAVVEAWPEDLEGLGKVPGFNSAKLEKYGKQVLDVCNSCKGGQKRKADDSEEATSPSAKRQARGSFGSISEDDLTADQKIWAKAALSGESLFLTGEAGTGKSFLLSYVIQELKKTKMVAVTASTGLAAASLGGSTIHSFAGVSPSKMAMEEQIARVMQSIKSRARWQETQVLVIDEVSMIDADLFSLLEQLGRRARGNDVPWGGLQVILCGDFLQLPPVESNGYAFQTQAWRETGLKLAELKTCIRQQGDKEFLKLLSEVRIGICSPSSCAVLARCASAVKPTPKDGIMATRLYCVNKDVDAENAARLAELTSELVEVKAVDSWKSVASATKPRMLESIEKTVPSVLKLKVNAQVIFTKNDPSQGIVNGTRGVILEWSDKIVQDMRCPSVRLDNGSIVTVEPVKHVQSDTSGVGELTRFQLPLKLGWALTVHKAQGCTLGRAELQLENAFDHGQVYVALSRVKALAGLWIKGKAVTQKEVKAHPSVLEFYFA